MGSARFPGKPLAPILGIPMIEHVYRRTAMCERLDSVVVATCDESIKTRVEAFGGSVFMTSKHHERATDRVAEAAEHVDPEIVVMIQGDEPMITSSMIVEALRPMLQVSSIGCVNLARQVTTEQEFVDPNTIKIVTDVNSNALYFSRAAIPSTAFGTANVLKQVCVIPFRRSLLRTFAKLPPTPLERAESIDMLRLIEHGIPVRIVKTEIETHAVDTPEDLRLVEELLRGDSLVQCYL